MWFYVILIEDAEHQRGELGRVALREELLVNPDETLYDTRRDNQIKSYECDSIKVIYLFGQETIGTVLEKSFVP